ncbi:MAG: hypothetical protein HQK79_02470 [Desulfobacterales bacterium]|nr:hypothetical protein [Desulfobacterales bacterium]MBF0396516.1 hypothetical protein [Desulfobacterales bacterium]
MKKLLALLLCLAFVCLSVSVFAEEKAATQAEQTITGKIEKKGEAVILKATDTEYTITGQDLTALVDKEVKVTGVVTEKTIAATQVEEVVVKK